MSARIRCGRELLRSEAPEGLELLAKMNVLGGLSATLADESAPLSGYEHVTGHMLDMGSDHFDRGLADHGAQVAVALIPHAIAFELLVSELDPAAVELDRCYPSAPEMERVVHKTFAEIDPSGHMARECWSDYAAKLDAWNRARPRFEALLADWGRHRERLRDLLTAPEEAVATLAAAGAPLRFDELEPPVSEQEGRWAFEHAHLMRKRFSAGDLYTCWVAEGRPASPGATNWSPRLGPSVVSCRSGAWSRRTAARSRRSRRPARTC